LKRTGWIDEPLYSRIKALMPIATVDLLIVYRGRLLLMLRNNEPAKDEWFTAGGRILHGETIEQAVHRVLEEETGLTPEKIEMKGAMSHIWPNIQTITIFHRVDVANDDVKMNDEHRDYKWISEVTDDLHPYLKEMIEQSEIFDDQAENK
jgi:ADP-ribose pyrophosphatase YjhB (NUDIX family)